MLFFVGLHQPADVRHFERAFISVNRLRDRRSGILARDWIMDSGAFSTIAKYGGYPAPVTDYADQVRRYRTSGRLLAAVTQDYMCEPWMLEKTGLTAEDHQRLTIERYDALLACDTGVYIMPVLQGYAISEYVRHLAAYGGRLAQGAWVGVGSVCKRNSRPRVIETILSAIHAVRPDLQLHGFGLKRTALQCRAVRDLLYSADSMAWSFAARREGRNQNDWREAQRYVDMIDRETQEKE